MVNFYIFYELNMLPQDLNAEFTLKDCLFGNVRIAKNADSNKYSYSGCCGSRVLLPYDWGKNAIIFEVHMNLSVHANNKNKDILILGKGKAKRLDNTTLTAEAKYAINFQDHNENFV